VVVEAMRKGYWDCAETLAGVVAGSGAGEALVSAVSLETRALTNKMSQLRAALASLAPPTQIITPAVQWAQSPDALFLNVKFSHKLDAPATLDVVVDSVECLATSITLRVSRTKLLGCCGACGAT